MAIDDLQLLSEFHAEIGEPDARTYEAVYRRAVRRRRRSRAWVVAAAAAAVLAATGSAAAIAYHFLGQSPGFTSGFSAFDRLPAAPAPSSLPTGAFESWSNYLGLSPDGARQRLRLLRTRLKLGPGTSTGHGELYALLGPSGSACMFVPGQGGVCVDAANAVMAPGVLPQILPGYPGQTPILAAIVADDVKSIEFDDNVSRTTLPIINNSVYLDLGSRFCGAGDLVATYDDGSQHTFVLHGDPCS